MNHTPCRLLFRMSRSLWIVPVAAAMSLKAALGDNLADEVSRANAPLPDRNVKRVDSSVYRWVFGEGFDAVAERRQIATLFPGQVIIAGPFGSGSNTTAARKQLAAFVLQNVEIVDRICGLTDAQRQKLELAGRGDSIRLLDRVETIGVQLQAVGNDQNTVLALFEDSQALRHGFTKPGIPKDSSMFVKVLEELLTAEQMAKYRPLRAIFHAGGLVQIRAHRQDESLQVNLTGTAFADADLVHLKELPKLYSLTLSATHVTDAGLVHLEGLTNLKFLDLNDTRLTDEGLAHLKRLTKLETLWLNDTKLTNRGLVHLEGLTSLRFLTLQKTQLTDAGLAHLGGLTNLEYLNLNDTRLTDAGLVHLKGLTNLESLWLAKTQVTDTGLAQLTRALPQLAIQR